MAVIELIIQNSKDGTIYDVSEIAGKISLEDKIEGSPKKLSFSLSSDIDLKIENGSVVRYVRNGIKKFYGFVFKIGLNEEENIEITAYDQTRYFKNKDTYVFKAGPIGDRLKKVASDYKMRVNRIDASTYNLPEKIYDDKTIGDMLQEGLNLTLINSGVWFILRDNFGDLEIVNIETLKTNLVVTNGSLLSKFNYEESIDSDTYTKIKLVKDNASTGGRDVYIEQDSNDIAQYGILQYYEVVDESANEAQIKEKAEQLMKLYKGPRKKLSLTCLGDDRIVAGSSVYLDLTLKNGSHIKQYALITSIQNTYENNDHTMVLNVEVE